MTAPSPMPCSARPAISIGHELAAEATTLPPANAITARVNGRTGPPASAAWPAATIPTMLASRNPLNAHP
jgi:hypothetical protein